MPQSTKREVFCVPMKIEFPFDEDERVHSERDMICYMGHWIWNREW